MTARARSEKYAGAGIRTRVIGLEGRSPDQLDYACLGPSGKRGAPLKDTSPPREGAPVGHPFWLGDEVTLPVQPEDPFDTVHLAAAREVEAFASALDAGGRMDKTEAHLHADNAYLFVEFLANTYPKMPEDAAERDLWVFLFDYSITQGPFAGPVTRLTPRSLALFMEFVARRHRVHEIEPIRAACAMEALYLQRLEGAERLAARALAGGREDEALARDVDAWWAELDRAMRERGLTPAASLAGGEEVWAIEMGPLEAAVFDALCLVLSRRARELARSGAGQGAREKGLLEAQRAFMTRINQGLGTTPLAAVLKERAELERRFEAPR